MFLIDFIYYGFQNIVETKSKQRFLRLDYLVLNTYHNSTLPFVFAAL